MTTDGYVDSWFWMNKPERHFVRSVDFSLLQRFLGSPCMDVDSILYGRGTGPKAILCTKRRHPDSLPYYFCQTRFSDGFEIRKYVDLGQRLSVPVYYLAYESDLSGFYLFHRETGEMTSMDLVEFCYWYGSVTGEMPNIKQIQERMPFLRQMTDKLLGNELQIKEKMPKFIEKLFHDFFE